ncbi:uncharacterized protein LOC113859867 [Abrus precatorius]|uniref:Uncharacterized protein LOC113859867 n=1 Tax=Abrus precatorius TaxID=3816 RepID=A0A8B8KWJ8_ABRPR|nr:uncharacterized protein LOC113859867 [Abrus precatorius]
MESFSVSCDHILAVLSFLNIVELPKCLVLDRWTKNAMDSVQGTLNNQSNYWDSNSIPRLVVLMHQYKELAKLACQSSEDFYNERDKVTKTLEVLRSKNASIGQNDKDEVDIIQNGVKDLATDRSEGSGNHSTSYMAKKSKGSRKCSRCKCYGHNKTTCPFLKALFGSLKREGREKEGREREIKTPLLFGCLI